VRRFDRQPNGAAGDRLSADAFYWRVLMRF
jgi:hypothetical protein